MKLTEAIVIKYFSSKKLAVLILVVMPLLLSIATIFSILAGAILFLVYILVPLIYGVEPTKFSAAQYFTERGIENTLIEHEYIKKIVCVEIPILIVFVALNSLYFNTTILYPTEVPESSEEARPDLMARMEQPGSPFEVLAIASYSLALSVFGGILRIIIPSHKRDFRFYLAKAFLWMASKEKEETKKTKYLIECIKSYDRYLREILNLQINDIKEIYSKLIIDSSIDKSDVIQSLSTSFENDNDKLTPCKQLAQIVKVQETQKFLVEQSILQIIKDLAIFFAGIIPVVITVIQALFQTTKSSP